MLWPARVACPLVPSRFVNDAATDATLRTYVDPVSGTAFRRIKHFSGYAGNAGFTDPPTDGSGTDTPTP